MKNMIIGFLITTACDISISQDLIIKKTGDEIKSKVIEIDEQKIKYRKFDNLSGPIYTITSSEIFMIKYENGSKDVLNAIESSKQTENNQVKPSEEPIKETTQRDSKNSTKVNSIPQKTKHFGISLGFGNSYNTNIGLNFRILLGNENFAIVPNVGIGIIERDEETPALSFGVRLQSEGYYIGYNYGYVGYEEHYLNFYEKYSIEKTGSTLLIGKEGFLDKGDSFGVHSSFGINLNGYDLANLSIFTFDLGLLYRF